MAATFDNYYHGDFFLETCMLPLAEGFLRDMMGIKLTKSYGKLSIQQKGNMMRDIFQPETE